MESIEDIIENKLFPALVELKEGEPFCFTSEDIGFALRKAKQQLAFYDFNSGAYSVNLQDKQSLSSFVSDAAPYNELINDAPSMLMMPVEKKKIFVRNLFKLDKIVDKICPGNYVIARAVITNLIHQKEKDPQRGQRIRKNYLMIIAAYDAMKENWLDDSHNVDNAIFFANTLYGKSENSYLEDLRKQKYTEPLSSPKDEDVPAWWFYNFLKTGKIDSTMQKMQSHILKDCSQNPLQINEYLKVVNNMKLGVMAHDGEIIFYFRTLFGLNCQLSNDDVQSLSAVFLPTQASSKFQKMLSSLMEQNNMFFNLNNDGKRETSTILLSFLNKNFVNGTNSIVSAVINDSVGFSNIKSLPDLQSKLKSFSFDLENFYTPNNINYLVRNFILDDKNKILISNLLKSQDEKSLKESIKNWNIRTADNDDFLRSLYEEVYQANLHQVDMNVFQKVIKQDFIKQFNSNVEMGFFLTKDEILKKEEKLFDKLKNFPNWLGNESEFKCLLSSIANNSSVNSPVRAYFLEKYPEDYKKVIYAFQNFRDECTLGKITKTEKRNESGVEKTFTLLFPWRNTEKFFDVHDMSLGMKNEEINKIRLNEIMMNVSIQNKSDSNENLHKDFKI